MNPILVDASQIREAIGTSIDVSSDVELGAVDVSGVTYTPREAAALTATLANGGEGIVLHGSIRAVFEVECSRCLTAFPFEIATDVDTLFVDESTEIGSDEQDVFAVSGDQIDLAPIIESALRVEMPLAPVCMDDCCGICPSCGADMNAESCACAEVPRDDGPFAALKDMLDPHVVED